MIRCLRALRRFVAAVRAWRQATRDYRALCDAGRAPTLQFSVQIHPESYEWTGLNGITGLKTTVPLTRDGKRYMAGVIRDIERTCIRAVLDDSTPEPARAGDGHG
ncbi:hypothetical protein ACFFMN_23910 [Planobispora siamensis]|uniref:Uncharacterized protein n=1 Tax=Planobispora siamensis TaxID=936338 RepID=A0A8J3STL4_9ACTN|nr:hypothetical protein [Planobispora siamensis]GIH95383.1 hypothetical protein Psi01_60130 [Planobispora siamensis]